jgi:hypothetical protein
MKNELLDSSANSDHRFRDSKRLPFAKTWGIENACENLSPLNQISELQTQTVAGGFSNSTKTSRVKHRSELNQTSRPGLPGDSSATGKRPCDSVVRIFESFEGDIEISFLTIQITSNSMSVTGPRSSQIPWNAREVSSLEPFAMDAPDPFWEFRFDSEPVDDCQWIPGQDPAPPAQVPSPTSEEKVPHIRKPYGHGIDARRTVRFHEYGVRDSWMYRYLLCRYRALTKHVLIELASAVIENAPESSRPQPPTRSEKRAKAGLLLWIDRNACLVLDYLRSHPPQ